MNKAEQVKKGLKLSDTDKRILLAYSNSLMETGLKPTLEAAAGIKNLRLS